MGNLAETLGKDVCVCEVRHVPVIRAYAEAIDLVGQKALMEYLLLGRID